MWLFESSLSKCRALANHILQLQELALTDLHDGLKSLHRATNTYWTSPLSSQIRATTQRQRRMSMKKTLAILAVLASVAATSATAQASFYDYGTPWASEVFTPKN